jgi:RHS repeat-associated protein
MATSTSDLPPSSAHNVTYATGASYAPPGELSALTLSYSSAFAGINLSDSYNSRLEPNEFKASSTAGNAFDLTYNFVDSNSHNNGNVIGITNNLNGNRSQQFTYDQVNRILTAQTVSACTASCWSQAFTYDQWGNLSAATATGSAPPLTITVGTNNQITTSGFTYDGVGNELTDVTSSYAWNAESQIKTANSINYTYDGEGNRVEKSNGKIYWYGAGSEILDESDLSGNITNEYVFFGGKRIAYKAISSGRTFYYAEDMLGTSRVMTTSTGTVCYDADYDADFYPFGGEDTFNNGCPQNYKFTGKERDAETDNDDFGARYYSSTYGRWLSADWSAVPAPVPYANLTNPQTLNLYAMVGDSPETFADLDGHVGGLGGPEVLPSNELDDPADEGGSAFTPPQKHLGGSGFEDLDNAAANYYVTEQDRQAQNQAQQQSYGRQPDGSYKADPAKVQKAIDSKTPIGNGQCVAACSRLSGVTPHTASWTPGRPVLSLNDTTDVGLAIASFGPNGKFTQPGGDQNSAIYMGHDKAGNVMVVDQWPPPNKPQYNAPFEHPLANYGPNSTQRMENNAFFYHVIVVP